MVGELPVPAEGLIISDGVMAEREFDRFVDSWDIDGDMDEMNEETREGFEDQKRRLIRGIRRGLITVGDDGEIVILLRHSSALEQTEVTLRVPRGAAYIGWDKFKERENVRKMTSMLGAMSGENPAIFAKMDGRDLKSALAVASLFLGS